MRESGQRVCLATPLAVLTSEPKFTRLSPELRVGIPNQTNRQRDRYQTSKLTAPSLQYLISSAGSLDIVEQTQHANLLYYGKLVCTVSKDTPVVRSQTLHLASLTFVMTGVFHTRNARLSIARHFQICADSLNRVTTCEH